MSVSAARPVLDASAALVPIGKYRYNFNFNYNYNFNHAMCPSPASVELTLTNVRPTKSAHYQELGRQCLEFLAALE